MTTNSCKHTRQIPTAHGLFCLDCGNLNENGGKVSQTEQVIQKHSPQSKPLPRPTMSTNDNHTIRQSSPTKISHTIKISVADITPKKRKSV